MRFDIVTLFPEMFELLKLGITGRAMREKLIEVSCWNPRDFTQNKYRNVDERPYGGGPGMVMMAQPLHDAIQAAKKSAAVEKPRVIHLSPQGKMFNQNMAEACVNTNMILIAGRYEGIDERVLKEVDEEWSIGDYVLSGGEIAALTIIDAVTRLIPGALGHEDSASEDSLSTGLLKYPQYTRPEIFMDEKVPEILLSGDHAAIARWRLKQSLGKTWLKRPDLLCKKMLTTEELKLLIEFVEELNHAQCHPSD